VDPAPGEQCFKPLPIRAAQPEDNGLEFSLTMEIFQATKAGCRDQHQLLLEG
jgi:hypothetical protein